MESRLKARLRRFATRNEIPVFNYHGVIGAGFPFTLPYQVPESTFEEQVHFLAKHRHCLTLDELCGYLRGSGRASHESVALTFDDGFANNLYRALPVLERYGVPATIFVASDYLGKNRLLWPERAALALANSDAGRIVIAGKSHSFESPTQKALAYQSLMRYLKRWPGADTGVQLDVILADNGIDTANRLAAHIDELRTLDQDEVLQLSKHELVTIGSHSVSHARLIHLPRDRARSEFTESKRSLEQIVGDIQFFAYPFGGYGQDFDDSHITLARESGYQAAFAVGTGGAAVGADLFRVPRVNVTSDVGLDEFEYLASGGGSVAGAKSPISVMRGFVHGSIAQDTGL